MRWLVVCLAVLLWLSAVPGEEEGPSWGQAKPWLLPPGTQLDVGQILRGVETNLQGHLLGHTSVSSLAWMRFKAKLMSQQAIKVYAVGSSVLGVHGGCTSAVPEYEDQCRECCFPVTAPQSHSRKGDFASFGAGWARIGFDYLQHKYNLPHNTSQLLNFARPGGSADVYNHCLQKWAPGVAGADLVLLELNIIAQDDKQEDGIHHVREVEGLVRQLLMLPVPPAILMVNFFNWCKDVPALCAVSSADPEDLQDLLPIFSGSGRADGRIRDISRRYGIPVVSHLHVFWSLYLPTISLQDAQAGVSSGLEVPPPLVRVRPGTLGADAHLNDGIHPTEAGNKVYGPVLALTLDEALAATPVLTASEEARLRPMQPISDISPLFGEMYRIPDSGVCFDFIRPNLNSREADIDQQSPDGADDSSADMTTLFHPRVIYAKPANIVASSGFWYEETVDAADGSERFKPGIVTESPGAFVDISYSPPPSHAMATARPEMCLTFMTSYGSMGQAVVSCRDACTCEELLLDGHAEQEHTIERTTCHRLEITSLRAECSVTIRVLEETASEGHGFKLTSLSFHASQTSCNGGVCM